MPLSLEFANARIEAFREPLVALPPHGFHGGPVLGATDPERRFRHTRNRVPVDAFGGHGQGFDHLAGEYAYGGPVYDHFGHTMAEFVHRIIPTRSVRARPKWLFVATANGPATLANLPAWATDIYRFLDVDLSSIVLTQNTSVDALLIAESGSDLGAGPYDQYLELLSDYTGPRLDRQFPGGPAHEKIYVSRTALTGVGQVLGERYVEKCLADEGFVLFHPELHPPSVQMDTYRRARVIVFPEGSACHGTELLGAGAMGICVFIPRRTNHLLPFERVLRPRAREFHSFPVNTYLGTALRSATDGIPVEFRGVTLYDFDRLVSRYRKTGIARLPTASRQAYLDCALEDLGQYLADMAVSSEFDGALARRLENTYADAARQV
jgi:hypothetical protein